MISIADTGFARPVFDGTSVGQRDIKHTLGYDPKPLL